MTDHKCQYITIQNDDAGIYVQCPICERVFQYKGCIIGVDGPFIDMEIAEDD